MFSCLANACLEETNSAVRESSLRSYQRKGKAYGYKIDMKMIGPIVLTLSGRQTT